MSKSWMQKSLMAVGLGVAAVGAFVVGLFVYVNATAKPLHQNPQDIPSATQAAAAADWAAAVDKARQAVRASLVEHNLPGLSVAVGVGGGLVWAEGFGYADLEKRTTITPGTRFRIGDASTVLTSAAAGLLLERQRLNLEHDIQVSVPQFPVKQWPVTLRQVMAHMAGIGSDGGDEGPLFSQRCERPVDALPFFTDRALAFEPGTRYRYSRFGWILVSAAVEAAAGEPFLTFMRDQVFSPLGMRDTAADSPEEPVHRATFYFPRFAADPRYGPDVMRAINLSCYAGAGAFLSTPSDLVRFGLGINGGHLLKPATVQLLQTPQRLPSGEETGYGLGWDLETVTLAGEQVGTVGHDGDVLGGNVASLMTFPDRGLVVAVTSNISYADTPAVALKIAEAFAGQEPRPAAK